MSSEEIRDRELRPLKLIQDIYEKTMLSMNKSFISSYEGIKVINIMDCLRCKRKGFCIKNFNVIMGT